MSLLTYIFSMSRLSKRIFSVFVDTLFIYIAIITAYLTRLPDFSITELHNNWLFIPLIIISSLMVFIKVGLYRAIIRYLSINAVFTIVISCLSSAVFFVVYGYYLEVFVPRSVPILYSTYLVILVGGSRLTIRSLLVKDSNKSKVNVIIYGAGDAGRQLLNLLRGGNEYNPVAFVDDSKGIQGTVVNGLRVFPKDKIVSLLSTYAVSKVLLALPQISPNKRKLIVESLVEYNVEVLFTPNIREIINGRAKLDQLREVAVEDLLGRERVDPKDTLLSTNILGKAVMVTGAGGSIGSELCRQIVRHKPKALILFELSEFALFQIDKELSLIIEEEQLKVRLVPILGSVQEQEYLEKVLTSFGIQTLYHAAAYKHVPLVEYNIIEGIKNNVFGTYYLALAAIRANVESFVLVSTDKAVRPTNIMGATKRLAELVLQSLSAESNNTRFCIVRFGNVLGSSGSVIPSFLKQIKSGSYINITHPDIVRYFMTIPEAALLVIQAGTMSRGGEVFLLDMGEPVKIIDLATSLIKLSGLEVKSAENPKGDIEFKYTGLRPGEKLFEELLVDNNAIETEHPQIMKANERYISYKSLLVFFDAIDKACKAFDYDSIYQVFKDAPIGYKSSCNINDLLWAELNKEN